MSNHVGTYPCAPNLFLPVALPPAQEGGRHEPDLHKACRLRAAALRFGLLRAALPPPWLAWWIWPPPWRAGTISGWTGTPLVTPRIIMPVPHGSGRGGPFPMQYGLADGSRRRIHESAGNRRPSYCASQAASSASAAEPKNSKRTASSGTPAALSTATISRMNASGPQM